MLSAMLFAICLKACDALRASRLPFPFESVFIKNVIVLSIAQTPISVVSVPLSFTCCWVLFLQKEISDSSVCIYLQTLSCHTGSSEI